jgi:hypothetical protein
LAGDRCVWRGILPCLEKRTPLARETYCQG